MEEVCSPFVPDSLSLVYMLLVFDLIMKDGRTLHCSNPLSDRLFVVTTLLWLWHLTGANTGACTSNCVTLSTPSTDILHFKLERIHKLALSFMSLDNTHLKT